MTTIILNTVIQIAVERAAETVSDRCSLLSVKFKVVHKAEIGKHTTTAGIMILFDLFRQYGLSYN